MHCSLDPVSADEKEILRNLLEKYLYEFSQYDLCEVNALGLYGYGYLDNYWTEDNRWAYFIRVDGKLAGFAMVNDYMELRRDGQYNMAEFFVLHKYRRMGIGRQAALELFARFPGRWELKYHPHNTASAAFWHSVVQEGAKVFTLYENVEEFAYPDGTPGEIFFFDT